MYAPLALSIPHGQDAVLILAVVIGSFALAEKGRPEAGAILSLGLIKFHLFVLWPLLLAVQKRWRMLGYFITGAAVLVASCILPSGRQGLLLYLDLLTRKDLAHLTPSPEKNANLIAVLLNLGSGSTVLYGILVALTVCLALFAVMRAPLWKLFAIGTSGSILVVPHAYGYDATMLLLPLWCGMFLSSRPATRVVSATVCLPIVFIVTLFGPPFSAALGMAIMAFFVVSAAEPRQDARRIATCGITRE
jgi:hypothetical protein